MNAFKESASLAAPSTEDRVRTLLAITALFLTALLLLQAVRFAGEWRSGRRAQTSPLAAAPAWAEMAAVGEDYTMVTTMGGNGEEILYVLNSRTGRLFVYEPAGGGTTGMAHVDTVDVAEAIEQLTPAESTGPGGRRD